MAIVGTLLLPAGASAATRLGVFELLPDVSQRVAGAQALGVDWVRASVGLGDAQGGSQRVQSLGAAGLGIVLNANTGAFPSDLAAYQARVRDAIAAYRPGLLVIENEEMSPRYYHGTPRQYLAQLKAATAVARDADQGVTNGGIVDTGTVLATWWDLWDRGKRADADAYAQRAFPHGRPGLRRALGDVPDRAHPHRRVLAHDPRLAVALANARTLIAGYARLPIDYVNFHWYQTGTDPWPLETAIRYLERATGKTAVTNELGQLDLAPSTVTAELRAVEAKRLPYVVWYGSDASGGTMGLRSADGALRPNGEAFRAYAAAHPSPAP